MKNLKLFFAAALIVTLITSCKKDSTDDRAQFLGTWSGNINLIIPDLSTNASKAEILTITAGTASASQIILTQTGSTVFPTGNVNGNTYTYNEYTSTAVSNGITITSKFNGTGTITGNTITESGTIVYTIGTLVYQGTWSSSLTKQ
jgi:hypothetical protein